MNHEAEIADRPKVLQKKRKRNRPSVLSCAILTR